MDRGEAAEAVWRRAQLCSKCCDQRRFGIDHQIDIGPEADLTLRYRGLGLR
jgi:hypothetical protein